ncbi:MAG: hypothetical protein ABI444_14490 [Candidatus Kapaibacterium sp.]|jgi:hypothetical protein
MINFISVRRVALFAISFIAVFPSLASAQCVFNQVPQNLFEQVWIECFSALPCLDNNGQPCPGADNCVEYRVGDLYHHRFIKKIVMSCSGDTKYIVCSYGVLGSTKHWNEVTDGGDVCGELNPFSIEFDAVAPFADALAYGEWLSFTICGPTCNGNCTITVTFNDNSTCSTPLKGLTGAHCCD